MHKIYQCSSELRAEKVLKLRVCQEQCVTVVLLRVGRQVLQTDKLGELLIKVEAVVKKPLRFN